LAAGTLLGSCLFNLSILALLDILHRPSPLLSEASPRHMFSAGLGILLITVAGGAIMAGSRITGLALGWLGIPSLIIAIVYLVGIRQIFRYEYRNQPVLLEPEVNRYDGTTTGAVWLRFALAAAGVIGAGIWLAFIGDEIDAATGWGASFVGSMFLAISTSMPELVVAIAALRLGAIDMAMGDILGANMLDVAHLFTVDLFYRSGPLLSAVSGVHLFTVGIVIIMNLVVMAGLHWRRRRKTLVVISWPGLALIGLYLLGAYLLFTRG
ncbi:MAG: sodium:calcium antiporter, partial [Chloroflexota bacterium]